MNIARVLAALFIVGLSLGLLYAGSGPHMLWSDGDPADLLYLIGLAVLVVLLWAIPRLGRIGGLALVVIVAIVGYAYRFELQGAAEHVLGALTPYRGERVGEGSISFAAWPDGQFRIDAQVNGTPVTVLVDTGATEVVLTPRDAERVGYDLSDLDFSDIDTTANGTVAGAPIVLAEVAIGPIRLRGVAASVNGASMAYSLLGTSFLDRLESYQMQDGVLTLTQ
ncbi:MAG TPA: TIGR02281 family clan AA aspartic protease [Geminicoccaceae bacterium]|nr:TIGR02281 family clan AA aspartic protease [Geminicoccaceae bacterium]